MRVGLRSQWTVTEAMVVGTGEQRSGREGSNGRREVVRGGRGTRRRKNKWGNTRSEM